QRRRGRRPDRPRRAARRTPRPAPPDPRDPARAAHPQPVGADPGRAVRAEPAIRGTTARWSRRPALQPAGRWSVIDSRLRLKAAIGMSIVVVFGLVAFAVGGLRIFERTYPLSVIVEDAAGLESGD